MYIIDSALKAMDSILTPSCLVQENIVTAIIDKIGVFTNVCLVMYHF